MVNDILPAILSFVVPGLGQALTGDIKKGAIFFIIALVLALIILYTLRGAFWAYLIYLIYSIYAAFNAYQMSQKL